MAAVAALLRHRTLAPRVQRSTRSCRWAWDLHTIFVPIYGARIGLSASQIGGVLSSFAAATFVVRFFMPTIARRLREHQCSRRRSCSPGGVYRRVPVPAERAGAVCAFVRARTGSGRGSAVVMSLLHTHAPAGRIGEAAGIRMALVNCMSVAAPLVLGANRRVGRDRSGVSGRSGPAWPPAASSRAAAGALGLPLQAFGEVLAEFRDLGRDDHHAVGLRGILGEVFLVIALGFVEGRRVGDFGDDRILPQFGGRELRAAPTLPSRAARASGRRSRTGYCVPTSLPWRSLVVGSWIVKKTVRRSRNERTKGLEGDAHDLGVAGAGRCRPSSYVGIRVAAAGVARFDRPHAIELVEHGFEAPEAAAAEHGRFKRGEGRGRRDGHGRLRGKWRQSRPAGTWLVCRPRRFEAYNECRRLRAASGRVG
jgi:hypothetical protein